MLTDSLFFTDEEPAKTPPAFRRYKDLSEIAAGFFKVSTDMDDFFFNRHNMYKYLWSFSLAKLQVKPTLN